MRRKPPLSSRFLFSILFISSQCLAQSTNPAAWNIRFGEDTSLHGVSLIERLGDSLSVLAKTGEEEIPIDSLLWVEKIVGKKSGIAIPIGIAGGAALGFLLGAELSKDYATSDLGDEGGIPGPIIGAVIGAGVGGVVGGLIGAGEKTERISLRRKSLEEKSSILDSILATQPITTDSLAPGKAVVAEIVETPPTVGAVFQQGWRFALKGGLAGPVGEFGLKSGSEAGLAKLGYAVGVDISLYLGSGVSWITSASFASNKVDESHFTLPAGTTVEAGSWFTLWPMTGFRFEGRGSSSFSMNGKIQVGMTIGRSPELTVRQFDVVGSVSPATGSSMAFAIGIGCEINRTFLFEVSYLSASPEYDILISSGGTSAPQEAEQGTGLVLFMLGVGF